MLDCVDAAGERFAIAHEHLQDRSVQQQADWCGGGMEIYAAATDLAVVVRELPPSLAVHVEANGDARN